jgi:NAD+ kinase
VTVILVTKRTVLEQLGSELDGLDRQSLAKMRASHDAHHKTLRAIQDELDRLKIRAWLVEGAEIEFVARPGDTVVCCGGDGTVLSASHRCGPGVRLMAINSDSERSKGRFCTAQIEDLEGLQYNNPLITLIHRMAVTVDGQTVSHRVLNEALFSHSCPAAMTRVQIDHDLYRCSGVWVGTSAGSTGALKSAGAEVLAITDPTLQAVVREPFEPDLGQKIRFYTRSGGFHLVNKTSDATLYLDGPFLRVPVHFDQEVRCSESPEPLEMLGPVT